VLEGPADEPEDRVGGRFGGDMGVRIQAVQSSETREAQVAEHVLGDQWRAEEENHVRDHDRAPKRPLRQRSRGDENHHIAGAEDQHQGLKALR
jgi:hypothetical protein